MPTFSYLRNVRQFPLKITVINVRIVKATIEPPGLLQGDMYSGDSNREKVTWYQATYIIQVETRHEIVEKEDDEVEQLKKCE